MVSALSVARIAAVLVAVVGVCSGAEAPAAASAAVNPFPRGSNSWWEHHLANTKPTLGGTNNRCACDCLVSEPSSALPLDCRCKCKKPPRGPTGPRGATGDKGRDGLPGPKGERGSRGPKGSRGPAGTVGPKGLKGHKGLPGIPGNDGVDGRKIAGLRGPKGAAGRARRGKPGAKGPIGPKGKPGVRGKPGRPVRGPAGSQGQQGRRGPPGDKGSTGNRGPRGPDGPVGKMGPPGQERATYGGAGSLLADAAAQAACAGPRGEAWVTAIARDCGDSRSCNDVCGSVRSVEYIDAARDGAKFTCADAIRVYPDDALHMYSYGSCRDTHCGPNYCCCAKAKSDE